MQSDCLESSMLDIFCLYVCVYLYTCVFIKGPLTYVMQLHQINYVICIKEAALNRKYHGWVTCETVLSPPVGLAVGARDSPD